MKLCEAATYGDCWARLLDLLPREGPGGESLVVAAGRDPNTDGSRPR